MATWYLGNPSGRGMIALPDVDEVTAPLDRAKVTTRRADGRAAVVDRPHTHRDVTLKWDVLGEADASTIAAFYAGLYEPGAYCLIDPRWTNVLPGSIGNGGARGQNSSGWVTSSNSTIAFDAVTATPAGAGASGVQAWTVPAVAGAVVVLGATPAAAPDIDTAAPVLPAEPTTFSFWAWSDASRSVTPTWAAVDGAGGARQNLTTPNIAVTTTPTRFTVTMAAGGFPSSSRYVVPRFVDNSTTAGVIRFAGCKLEYAAAASPWTVALGVPRMEIAETLGDEPHTASLRDVTLSLVEV